MTGPLRQRKRVMEGLAPLSIRGIVNRKPRALVCKQRLRSKQCSPYPTQEQVILEENWGTNQLYILGVLLVASRIRESKSKHDVSYSLIRYQEYCTFETPSQRRRIISALHMQPYTHIISTGVII